MEEDEEDHDGNYDREAEDEDDSERYDLEDDREEEIANAIQDPGILGNIEPVEDHNEA